MTLEEVELISRCFFPADHRIRSDVAIIFGMNDPRRPVDCALELFHAGMVGKLLFTGGYNRRLGCPEAHEMQRMARLGGVPAEAILVEDEALNTEENVRFSYRLLYEEVESDRIESIMLVTIQFHLRRAYLAARRQFPAKVALCWTCYPSLHYTSRNWAEVEEGRRDVAGEIEKINRYYGMTLGDLGCQDR